jgi:DNA-binding Lrp family transcriptional regulator
MTDTELPEFIERDLLLDMKDVEVPDQAFLKCFVQAKKPFLSKSAVAEVTGLSGEATRQRLNSLVDRGVLMSAEAGKQTKIYWLNDPRSRWPVPNDMEYVESNINEPLAETVVRINRLTTFAMLYAVTFASFYVLEWLSGFPATDGIFEVTLNWDLMALLAFALMGVVFYIGLQTSLLVENEDAGWPTIRRMYRYMAG